VFDYLSEQRQQDPSVTAGQRTFALNFFGKLTAEEQFHHAAKQAHIALGLAVAAAALAQVDATPMEGFDPAALDELLGLRAKGLRSSMLLALGYRDEAADWNLKLKKLGPVPLDAALKQANHMHAGTGPVTIRMVRAGTGASIELFQYQDSQGSQQQPGGDDVGATHISFYTSDIKASVAYLKARGVKFLGEPFLMPAGDTAGET
nr:hypothetical protein [Tanacetum cinerariifolium]